VIVETNATQPSSDAGRDCTNEIWSQRAVLDHIHRFARSRSVAPYAVLACVLRRAISCIEPTVKLPAIIGGPASVNLFTASTGRSGQGKDAADAAGCEAINFVGLGGNDLEAVRPSIGTGEGLARLFKGHIEEQALTRAHLIVPEVTTLAALASRQGATLAAELLKAYMGQALGFDNSRKDTTTSVAQHSYRLCLGVGVQTENADFFLSREKDGLPQRFLWVPTIDPDAPRDRPSAVEPITVTIPNFGTSEYLIEVPQTVAEAILDHRYLVLTGSKDVDPLDGHLMLTQEKIAFGLAILESRKDISTSDWSIAGQLLEVSKETREGVRATLKEQRQRKNTESAFEKADRQAIISSRLRDKTQERVVKAITGKIKRAGRATRNELRQNCDSSIRRDFDPVFEMLVDVRFLVPRSNSDGQATEYEFAQ
jgi:hypothetical protein